MNREQVVCSDCLEYMKTMPENSVDSIVTDPPYGLEFMGAEWDAPWKSDDHVGKTWDSGMSEVVMADGYKRLKRPSFENTQNVRCRKCGKWKLSSNPCTCAEPDFPNIKLSNMRTFQQYMTPIFAEAIRVAKPGAHLLCFGGTRTFHRMACAIEDAGWEIRDCIMWVYGSGFPKSMDVSKAIDKALGAERKKRSGDGEHIGNVDFGMKNRCPKCGKPYFSADPCKCPREDKVPVTDQAKEWDGWGTCLKPAWEPIIVARKPLDGTVAKNVLKWGVGAMNIDACRVATNDELSTHGDSQSLQMRNNKVYGTYGSVGHAQTEGQKLGRFPANLVHDGSQMVLDLFPQSKGQQGDVTGSEPSRPTDGVCYGEYNERQAFAKRGDSGSAARFFYCAKASKKDRGEGNNHPTVKPTELMKWLVKLVTPEGGVVLDPFAGSGTTLVAAKMLGRDCIGIEREKEYVEIIKRRLETA